MKSKRFIISALSVFIACLLLIACFQIVVDPLFQYHTPLFGMKPVLTDERYQYAGVARNFGFDTVILGNSFCENFKPSDLDCAFGGKTVKLAVSGSIPKDWALLLEIIKQRAVQPGLIVSNMDPYSLLSSDPDAETTLPGYLYDGYLPNDVGYFYNFGTLSIAFDVIKRNITGAVPDPDTVFLKNARGREAVINGRDTIDEVNEDPSVEDAVARASANLEVLLPYLKSMPGTEFRLFFTPVSILYWYKVLQERNFDCWYAVTEMFCEKLLGYPNVKLYLWSDDEMLGTISDLDNYADEAHCSPEVCERLIKRMSDGKGLLSSENYRDSIDRLFGYAKSFDYTSLIG